MPSPSRRIRCFSWNTSGNEIWFRSLCRYAKHTRPTEYRRYIYGHYTPDRRRNEHIRIYIDHNQAGREYFRDRPHKLVELCWELEDG